MGRCPKCELMYDDDEARICRSCGAILAQIADDAAESSLSAEEDPAIPAQGVRSVAPEGNAVTQEWTCPKCGETVPATFHICWNCESEASLETSLGTDAPPTSAPAPAPSAAALHCPSCGSTRVIPGITVADTGQYAAGHLAVVVDAAPGALIFKNRLRGELLADVCGDCGHAQLRVRNPGELYEHYRRSLE